MGLFEPNWMSHDVEKALKAVDRIADKSKLLTISLSPSAHFDLRMRAIKKLKNRVNAIEKLTDQDMLVAIAKDHMRLCPVFTAQERLAAIMKLTDKPLAQKLSQEIYITIATSARYPDHDRLDAADKLINEDLAQEICTTIEQKNNQRREKVNLILAGSASTSFFKRLEAADELMNRERAQEIYLEIAKNTLDNGNNRVAAAERLADQNLAQEIYYEVAMKSFSKQARAKALEKLTDQKLLADFTSSHFEAELRIKAAKRLLDQSIAQDVYIDIAKKNIENDVLRKTVVARIMDLSTLSECERDGHKWIESGTHDEERLEMRSGPDFYYDGWYETDTYQDYKCEGCGVTKSTHLSTRK